MLAYAANAPRIAERRSAPNTLLFIIAGHVAVLAAVMSARTITSPTHRGDAATARNVVRGHRMTPISLGRNPSVDGETSASGTELNQSPNTANVQFCSLWAAAQH